MSQLLLITASLKGDASESTALARSLCDTLATDKKLTLDTLDLDEARLPHLSMAEMGAWMTDAKERTEEQATLAARSDNFIAQLQKASAVVIAMPMYNLGVPSTFKAWIDRIARAGATFKYTETGPVGLLQDKPVIVVCARGGMYQGTELDTQTPYLKSIFGLMGITNLQFVYAEGLNTPAREDGLAAAKEAMAKISI